MTLYSWIVLSVCLMCVLTLSLTGQARGQLGGHAERVGKRVVTPKCVYSFQLSRLDSRATSLVLVSCSQLNFLQACINIMSKSLA